MNTPSAPAFDQENRRVAWVGLGLSIAGLIVPVLVALICSLVTERDVTAQCLVLFGLIEVAALGCGIVARRERAGKAALIISSVSLVLSGIVVVLSMQSRSGRTDETSSATNTAVGEGIDKAFGELGKQLEAQDMELKRKAAVFLIDGERDDEHHRELFLKIQGLMDAGAAGNNSVRTRGAYYQGDTYYQVSPITDISAAIARIDFGRVAAVDPINRIVLVDASAKPAPPPADGWPGAEAIDQYILRKTTTFAAENADKGLVEKFGRDRVIVVWMPEIKATAPGDDPIGRKLRMLAPDTVASSGIPGFGPQQKSFWFLSVAPISDVNEVVKALDGESILAVDQDRRVILLGDLAGLSPEAPEGRQPEATQPK